MATCDVRGFVAWETTQGTFIRKRFHWAFVKQVVMHLNPWPLSRSIVLMDNALIHMYKEIEEVVHRCRAMRLYVPPYCSHLNPIEEMFGRLKSWIQRHGDLVFSQYPELVLKAAMKRCLCCEDHGTDLFHHCGYASGGVNVAAFTTE
ncbi:hypothetical protein PI124_g20120 [Phytophthora idaei]|nr:hypothetical protein PI125_g19902 [Phytophthora idaei]KAG3132500.1 hypothetical protein PI126_g19616 [Phytophthora idaei]KAG3234832.1 hypothetical protein PI124_g20120 [Phytophthora idaei]